MGRDSLQDRRQAYRRLYENLFRPASAGVTSVYAFIPGYNYRKFKIIYGTGLPLSLLSLPTGTVVAGFFVSCFAITKT